MADSIHKVSKQLIDDFFKQKRFAVVGASRNPNKFGSAVYRDLKAKGFEVYPVNPQAESIGHDRCYPDLKSLPQRVDAIVVVVPPAAAEKAVQDSFELHIPYVWLQQGSESDNAIRFCQEHTIKLIHHHCIFMFLEPVSGVHGLHRWIAKLFGKVPSG